MFLLISNLLISSRRIWTRPNKRIEEMLYIYRDIHHHHNINIEEECWESCICSSELLFYNHGSRPITWSSILWFLMMLFILCILSFILLIFDKSSLCYWIADWYSLQFSHSCLYCLLIHTYCSMIFYDIPWIIPYIGELVYMYKYGLLVYKPRVFILVK